MSAQIPDRSSTDFASQSTPRHVAIIMDGNWRWPARRGRPARDGHRAGVRTAVRIVRAAARTRIECLTLFAFSSANWRRAPSEVGALFALAERALGELAATCVDRNVRVCVLGRTDRLPPGLARGLERLARETSRGERMLRIALDYSSREAIVRAASGWRDGDDRAAFEQRLTGGAPPVDLLIRTGGEQRLSDFLLYECAFAELFFSPRLWPDFDEAALAEALAWFGGRQRRFGG
ncbi:MAG TPA: polyprenyl diphosphate synthase [Pseudomonadales bacterium]